MTIPPAGAAAALAGETFAASRIALNVETTGLSEMSGVSKGLMGIAESVSRVGVAGYIAGRQLNQSFIMPTRIGLGWMSDAMKKYKDDLQKVTNAYREGIATGKLGQEQQEKLLKQQEHSLRLFEIEKKLLSDRTQGWAQLGGTVANVGYTMVKNIEFVNKVTSDMMRISGAATGNIEDYYDAQISGLKILGTEGAERARTIFNELLNLRSLTGDDRQQLLPVLAAISQSVGPEAIQKLVPGVAQYGREVRTTSAMLLQLDIVEQNLGITQGVLTDGVFQIVNNLRLMGVTLDDVMGSMSGYFDLLGKGGKDALSTADALDLVANSLRAQKSLSFNRGVGVLMGMGPMGYENMSPTTRAALDQAATGGFGKRFSELDVFQKSVAFQGLSGASWTGARGEILQNLLGKSPYAQRILGGKSFVDATNWQVRALANDPMLGQYFQMLGYDQEGLVSQQKILKHTAAGVPGKKQTPFTQAMGEAVFDIMQSLTNSGNYRLKTVGDVRGSAEFKDWLSKSNFTGEEQQVILEGVVTEIQQASRSSEGLLNQILTQLEAINTSFTKQTGGWISLGQMLGGSLTTIISLLQLIAFQRAFGGIGDKGGGLGPWIGLGGGVGRGGKMLGKIGSRMTKSMGVAGAIGGLSNAAYGLAEEDYLQMGLGTAATGLAFIPHPAAKIASLALAATAPFLSHPMETGYAPSGGAGSQNVFSRASGGPLPTTGMYMGHKGEFVIPASGLAISGGKARAQIPGGGGDTHVTLNVTLPSGRVESDSFDILEQTFGSTPWMMVFSNKVVQHVKPVVDKAGERNTF